MGLRVIQNDTNNKKEVGICDKDMFVKWLLVRAMIMNILA